MFRHRSLFAVAIAGALLAACQHAPAPAKQSSDDTDVLEQAMAKEVKTHGKYAPSAAFKAKADELGLRMMERILSKCVDATGAESIGACYHERMLQGFDTDGTIKSHCPQRDDLEADMKCIVLGGIGHELATKMGKNAPTSFDWSDPETSANKVAMAFVLQQVRDCLSNGAASDPKDCVTARFTKALDLTSSDLEPCNALIDEDFKYGQCIGEAFSYKYMSTAIARM